MSERTQAEVERELLDTLKARDVADLAGLQALGEVLQTRAQELQRELVSPRSEETLAEARAIVELMAASGAPHSNEVERLKAMLTKGEGGKS